MLSGRRGVFESGIGIDLSGEHGFLSGYIRKYGQNGCKGLLFEREGRGGEVMAQVILAQGDSITLVIR
jgi:hypothetical protein